MQNIRGAITVKNNNSAEILEATMELLQEIIKANNLNIDKITAIFFSCTKDLTIAYPAKAARDMGITHAALMCLQEMHVENSLPKCIRVCFFYDKDGTQDEIRHIYLREAASLRPDLLK